jgi:Ni2+-binding GTPase involved in maturation of urease and hydrogenase
MAAMRFVMLGGFLGAGKTTALARLASHYTRLGKRVGLVTNDQAQNLVDTNSLRAQGFAVEEVPGACFCCKFDELVGKVGELEEKNRPEIILTEPVGSCTDLVATVIQPLKDLFKTRFHVAPYAVLFKPSHGLRILRDESAGFSPKAAYIFRKQLEEADAIVINRLDEMSPADLEELRTLLAARYPGVPVIALSAKSGEGFGALIELLRQDGAFGRRILEIDYDTYAEGEAELGWLNSSVHVQGEQAFDLDQMLLEITRSLGQRCQTRGGEIAHLKVIGLEGGAFGVANIVSTGGPAELSLASGSRPLDADLVINARVAIDPDELAADVRAVVEEACRPRELNVEFRLSQSLRPGRPTPTHRYGG